MRRYSRCKGTGLSCHFYVYAFIRARSSSTADAGTPYYIGKGQHDRAFSKRHPRAPKNRACIVLLETGLTELGAFALERRLIRWWGRADKGVGILRNCSDGGDGATGAIRTVETRVKISRGLMGKPSPKSKYEKSPNYKPATLGTKFTDARRQRASELSRGENNSRAKLKVEEVRQIKRSVNTVQELSDRFGVSKSTVNAIKSGRIWSHITDF